MVKRVQVYVFFAVIEQSVIVEKRGGIRGGIPLGYYWTERELGI